MYVPMWIDYDKITDSLMYLSNGASIQFSVNLKYTTKTGETRSFHNEYIYGNGSVSIKRQYDFCIIIKLLDQYVMITINDIYLIRMQLDKIEKWFTATKTFGIKNQQLFVVNKKKPIRIYGLVQRKWLEFEPIVITYEDGMQEQGVRMTLSDYNYFVDIGVNKFFGMKYLFDTVDMFQMAQNMLNYVGRPERGTNITDLRDQNSYEHQQQYTKQNKIKKSFFN